METIKLFLFTWWKPLDLPNRIVAHIFQVDGFMIGGALAQIWVTMCHYKACIL